MIVEKVKTTPGTVILGERMFISVFSLLFDKQNLRLAHFGNLSEKNLENTLWGFFHLDVLYEDIRERGLQEPLILYPEGNIVLEGNRRLAVLRRLAVEAEDTKDPVLKQFYNYKVPCFRVRKNTPDEDIEAYLTSIHVARKEPWEKYNRAKMLHKLYHKRKCSYETVARIAEISRGTAKREIVTFEYLNNYSKKYKDPDWIKKYYHIWEFMAPKISKYRVNEQNIQIFLNSLSRGIFRTSKDVREYVQEISLLGETHSKITQQAIKEKLEEINRYRPTFKSPIYDKITSIIKILKNFPESEIEKAISDSERRKFLEVLADTSDKLLEKIEKRRGK